MKRLKIKLFTILGIMILLLLACSSVSYAACAMCTSGNHQGCTGSITFKYQNESCDWVYCCDGQKALYYANHDWGDPYTITKYATCTAKGTKTSKACSRCGRSKTISYGPLGHNMGSWYVSKNETCTANGENRRDCQRSGCSHYETSVRPALGHNFSTSWTYDSSNHWHVCLRSGCNATSDTGAHSDTNKDGYCNTCRYQMYVLVPVPNIDRNTFVYNGHEQSPTFTNYDTGKTTISDNVKIHVGNYTAKISLAQNSSVPQRWKERYQGTGNTTGAISYNWSITKKRVVCVWGTSRVFECDKNRTQIVSATIPSGVDVDTINPTVVTAKTFVGDYTAECTIGSVTGVGNTGDYYLDPNPTKTTFKIVDTTIPTITVSQNYSDWTNQDVVFTLTADDSGQGVDHMEYSMDGITWRRDLDTGATATSAKKTFTTSQDNLIYFRSIDKCDNISKTAGPYKIKIDKIPPTFTYTKNPERDWTNQDVLLTILANDNLGVKSIKVQNVQIPEADLSYRGMENDRITTIEGKKKVSSNGTYTVLITDVAGNTTTGNITVSNIDKTKPTIVSFPTQIHENEQTITARDEQSKMRYVAVCTSNTEPVVFGDGSATEGTQYNYYYQVTNDTQVSFKFNFSSEGTFYVFARDLAGNSISQQTVMTYRTIDDPNSISVTITPTEYTYDGLPHVPTYTLVDKTKTPNKTMVEGTDYTMSVVNNIDYGTATMTFTGKGNYKGTITKTFQIKKRKLNIVPDSGQSKLTLVNDPVFTYTYNNQVPGEVPKFQGKLSRDAGEGVGLYNITIGSLTHVDNLPEKFKKNNYEINFQTGVKFEISNFNALTTKWRVSSNGGSIELPIPGYASNDYIISWGDGKMDKVTQAGFPKHTYATAGDYVVRVAGTINTFGYVGDNKPTASNAYKNYYSASQNLIQIIEFGNVKAKQIGFSYCANLAGTIPARSGFDGLTSVENMFNECVNLVGPVPSSFFANIPSLASARKVFNNCKKLTGGLDPTVFSNSANIKTFEDAYNGCIALSGAIPQDMFATNINVTNFARVFANMNNISGAIPEKLFEKNTKAESFAEAFSNDTKLNSIPEKLFEKNLIANNYYRTFYNCTRITEVPTKLFTNNVVGTISNESNCYKDYRGTFERCTGLTYIDIDPLMIGKEMFKGCTAIQKIVLLNVVELGESAFYGCNSLTHIKINKDNLAKIGKDAFEYTGANPPLLTYVNTDNDILFNYNWADDKRTLDSNAPKGTVEIVSDKYPFTKVEQIRLRITVTDDISRPENCKIAILNDADLKDFTPEQIAAYRQIDSESTGEESVFKIFDWQSYVANKDWTLTNGEGIKKVYVYFMDEVGNISFVTQDLELVK